MKDTQDSVPKMRKGIRRRRREGLTTILLSHLFQNCLFMYPVFKDTCQRHHVSTFSSGAVDFTRLPGILKDKKRTLNLLKIFKPSSTLSLHPIPHILNSMDISFLKKNQPTQTNDMILYVNL